MIQVAVCFFVGRPSNIQVNVPQRLRRASDGSRDQLVSYSARLLDDGLAVGSAGNMSVRAGDTWRSPRPASATPS